MAENTNIEWCDSTFNPWMGCTKVSIGKTGGGGCDHCYAEHETPVRVHRGQGRELWGPGAPRVRTSAANWRKPIAWNARPFFACVDCGWRGEKPFAHPDGVGFGPYCQNCTTSEPLREARRRVFCASLADVFDNEVPREWRADLFTLIRNTPNLDWLLLTKRIGNAANMIAEAMRDQGDEGEETAGWPWPHVWLGATIVNQKERDRDLAKLLAVPAYTHFISMEPLLSHVDMKFPVGHQGKALIDWVIVGGESGPNARPMHPDWARSLRDQCETAGVPFMFKQWGEWGPDWEGAETCGHCGETKFDAINASGGCGNCGSDSWQQAKAPLDSLRRVGKKAAGRLLDGKTHDGFPEVRNV